MSKVICDICGTTYAESASQCPICGCAKPENPQTVPGETTSGGSGYTYVRGGRFSKANVKKRNKAMLAAAATPKDPQIDDPEEEEEGHSNRGLVIAILVLLLAIAVVLFYIYISFFAPAGGNDATDPGTSPSTSETTTAPTTETTLPTVPCTGITLAYDSIELNAAGKAWLLNVEVQPADTTDVVQYSSSNDQVAQVSDTGRITAVGHGEAIITITCGEVSTQCVVNCVLETEPTTEPATEPTTAPTEPLTGTLSQSDFRNIWNDMSLTVGESFMNYKGEIDVSLIKFYSDDESIATIENGKITAVGVGTTNCYAEYNGQVFKFVVRVKAK